MKKIAPSILSADFNRLGEEVKDVEKAGADYIHIDIMDGHFVPNITIGPPIVEAIRRVTELPLDVHLMIEQPERFIKDFIRAGSDIITVHVEVAPHLHGLVHQIKNEGGKVGVSLNPTTPVFFLEHIIDDIDLILQMTVNPGFGGQRFIPSTLIKIERIRELIDERNATVELEADGGIKVDNIGSISKAGATTFVSGSGIFGTEDYEETIRKMRERLSGSKQ